MTTNTWEHNEYLVNKWNGILDYCSDTMAAVYGYAERVNVAKLLENAECEICTRRLTVNTASITRNL